MEAAVVVERNSDEEALGMYASEVEADRGKYVEAAEVVERYAVKAAGRTYELDAYANVGKFEFTNVVDAYVEDA